ncbi:DUF732 domain-containing protein [Mycobacterium basiliense]
MAFMAEPVPASDETAALDGDETAAVPNPTPTAAVETAWSRIDDRDAALGTNDPVGLADGPVDGLEMDRENAVPDEPAAAVQSWRTTVARAIALLMIGLGFAALIVVGGWALTREKSPDKTVVRASAAPPTATATTAPPTTTIASTPDQDSGYIKALNDRGISFANPDAAIYNGKLVCLNFRRGLTREQIVAAFRSSNPALANHADAYVDISMRTYCP